jgi:choline-sulfatase
VITRRAFSASLAPAILRGAGSRLPNLLFLIADDHAAYVMGCDGNRHAQTPHIDGLARESVRFAAHYCNSPVCTPSRQSILTGQMPHHAGVTLLGTPLDNAKPTLARSLRDAGYRTGVFGKMHFNRPGAPGIHGFERCETEDIIQSRWSREVEPSPLPDGIRAKKLPWRPFQTPAREWLNAECLPFPRTDAAMKSSFVVQQAAQFLEEHRAQPFALWVSFQEPHSPFDFPVEDRAAFTSSSFDPPRIGEQDGWQIPLVFHDLTPAERQGIIAAYYSSTAFLDRNIGRVLGHLQRLGLDRDTLVIYTADHGYCLGHHGRFEKHCGYEPALRIPLMARLPGRFRPRVVREFTEHVDLAPTVLELLRAQPFEIQHGASLVPYLEGRRPRHPRDHIFSEYLENEEVYVRDAHWKLIYGSGRRARKDGYLTARPLSGRDVRLFDLHRDPGEYANVAGQFARVVERLTALALQRFRDTHPETRGTPGGSIYDQLDFFLTPRDQLV